MPFGARGDVCDSVGHENTAMTVKPASNRRMDFLNVWDIIPDPPIYIH